MDNSFSSIEDLLQPKDEDKSAGGSGILDKKIDEITQKHIEDEVAVRAARLGLGYTNLVGFPILTEAIKLIDKETAQKLQVVCFLYAGDQIRLGLVDESNLEQIKKIAEGLEKRKNAKLAFYLISENSFQTALKFYDLLPKHKEQKRGVEISPESFIKYQKEISDFAQLEEKIKTVNLTDIIVLILASATKMDASDVHIEAEEKRVVVRFRIDGVLHDVAELEADQWDKLISRIKLVSHLKLNITDKPQDGRFTIFLPDDKVEVRVSTIPTAYGESVVMRLLRSSAVGLQFEDLGLQGIAYERMKEQIKRPNGMIITTGPTGSGKTTTLYAILNLLNKPDTKIITLEDPIEYKLEGINQSQIDSSHGYSFAKGLRSILRQDPDVIMVGEIRDEETVDISINAALTGHLVISTIHTNSAAGAIPRFIAMNAKPFLLAPALNAVIGQRLVRRICTKCKVEEKLDNDTLAKVEDILSGLPEASGEKDKIDFDNLKFYKGKGCEACHNLGYKGRVGIYEVLLVSPEIEKMILAEKVSEYEIEKKAKEEGMVTMVQDGLLKALQGITSVEEVFKKAE